tara:strand:- start:11 stop:724 length:714 start_codon:yes stop_codon:yes gene_type:complete
MAIYQIKKATDSLQLAKLTSSLIAESIRNILVHKPRCQIALSGGSTPRQTYTLLKDEKIAWRNVDIFLGDERWVDPNDISSNSLMIRNTLLSNGYATEAVFHPVPFSNALSPQECALSFATLISQICQGEPPVLDLVLLGLGDDGHTASLFPNTDSLEVNDSITTVSRGGGYDRITLTTPAFNCASQIIFLVSGKSKQTALKRLIDPSESYLRTPAKLIQTANPILILADEDAAKHI